MTAPRPCTTCGQVHEFWQGCRLIPPLPPVDARCLMLGLTLIYLPQPEEACDGGVVFRQQGHFVITPRAKFAHQILHGPWDRVVRRRALALEQKLFNLETMLWFWNQGDSRYGMEIMDLRGQL